MSVRRAGKEGSQMMEGVERRKGDRDEGREGERDKKCHIKEGSFLCNLPAKTESSQLFASFNSLIVLLFFTP
jgi:hypothetical protein